MGGPDVPEISPEQLAEIANIIFSEVGPYVPKFAIAFCAILCEESKKQRKEGRHAVLEFKSEEINKMTEQAIKMADDPEFDPMTVSVKKQEEEDKEEGMREKVEGAVDAALQGLEDEGGDEGGSSDSKVTSETVRDAVVPQLGSIKADLLSKMAGVPEAIAGKAIDSVLGKAVQKLLFVMLTQFATLIVAEWNKLIKEGKSPKKLFKRAQKICKAISDLNSLKENVAAFMNAVQSGDALGAAEAAKGAVDDANNLKDDKENLEQIKKNKDDNSHSAGGD